MSMEAIAADGSLRAPTESGEMGSCFECSEPMRARVGAYLRPHWAHVADTSKCVYRSEDSEGHWHKAWKYRLERRGWALEQTRVVGGERHRADVTDPNGTVIELQNGFQDIREIRSREAAYPHMMWLINGTVLLNTTRWQRMPGQAWGHGRFEVDEGAARSMHYMRRPVIIDNSTAAAFRHQIANREDAISQLGNRGVTGMFYVGYWNVGMSGGVVDVQAIHLGWDPEAAAGALDGWFHHVRWAV